MSSIVTRKKTLKNLLATSQTNSSDEILSSSNNKKSLFVVPAIALLFLAKKIVSIHSQYLFENTSYILSLIMFLAGFGVTLERNTTIGKALSAPLATMTLALTVANLGFAPFSSTLCKSPEFLC